MVCRVGSVLSGPVMDDATDMGGRAGAGREVGSGSSHESNKPCFPRGSPRTHAPISTWRALSRTRGGLLKQVITQVLRRQPVGGVTGGDEQGGGGVGADAAAGQQHGGGASDRLGEPLFEVVDLLTQRRMAGPATPKPETSKARLGAGTRTRRRRITSACRILSSTEATDPARWTLRRSAPPGQPLK
jgi:hypothetical protein